MNRDRWIRVTASLVVATATACSIGGAVASAAPLRETATSTSAPSSTAAGSPAAGSTVWLCKPGMANDPCLTNLSTTVQGPNDHLTVVWSRPAANPPIDCFYVYPTVSTQPTPLANLNIDPQETAVARAQASRFSQVCRVYAPMYRQLTLYALSHPAQVTPQDFATAYGDVASAWNDYLAHFNNGRGVVVIGHSQGAAMVIRLLRNKVDDNASVRHRLVSAIILGGNVTVPIGKSVGGSFQHIPACRSARQTGCVIAYSSFDQPPPSNSLFGRPGQGVSSLSGSTSTAGFQVLCVNPASPAGGTGPLLPFFPTASSGSGLNVSGRSLPQLPTPWVSQPRLYTGQCRYENGASWLQVTDIAKPGDHRTVVQQTLGPTWGLHLVDVNIALGNLVGFVASQAAAYRH